MKSILFMLLIAVILLLNSCSVVEGIFKAGVWVGIIAVAVIIGLIIYFVGKARK
jgi:hypothetical protein